MVGCGKFLNVVVDGSLVRVVEQHKKVRERVEI